MAWHILTLGLVMGTVFAEGPITFQYLYDDRNQLSKVIDSTGIVIEYIYDSVGNILEVRRSTLAQPGALTIFNITPQQGGPASTVTIQGQGFSTTPASNAVRFNGVATTVLSATANTLVVVVPSGATTGPVSVTVGNSTATSSNAFTVLPNPAISSVLPTYVVAGTIIPNFVVTGVNLSGSIFSLVPALSPPAATVGTAFINPTGTSATLSISVGANAVGTFVIVASRAGLSSSLIPTTANSFRILSPTADEDHDGLTNAQEVGLGTDPFKSDTDGDGFPDGVEVLAGSNPLDPLSTPLSVTPVSEAVGPTVSFLNVADPSQNPTADPSVALREAAGATVSILNLSDPSLGGTDPATTFNEGVGPTVTVMNSGSSGPTAMSMGRASSPVIFRRGPVISLGSPDQSPVGPLYEGQSIVLAAAVTDDGPRAAAVEFLVNGVQFGAVTNTPFELPFTIPAGIASLTLRADARDAAGNVRTIGETVVQIAVDPRTTVSGRVVDTSGAPVAGAQLDVRLSGLRGEFFRFDKPPAALPDLTGRVPDLSRFISSVNMRNPNRVFGNDPFGLGFGSNYAARLLGWLRIAHEGSYTFTLGADEGARLIVNGATVVDVAGDTNSLQEASGKVSLPSGLVPIEIRFYHSRGFGELQLSYTSLGGDRQVVPEDWLVAAGDPIFAIGGEPGGFVISGMPSNVDRVWVNATAEIQGRTFTGSSQEMVPARGYRTDAGSIVVKD